MTTGTIINGPSGATGALIEGGDQTNAVLITGVGTVVNYAKIIGVENPGDTGLYYGVRLGGASGSISNLGNHALIENYIGVYAADNDTVTNAGTIASNYAGGRDALVFGGGTNRLIIDPGASVHRHRQRQRSRHAGPERQQPGYRHRQRHRRHHAGAGLRKQRRHAARSRRAIRRLRRCHGRHRARIGPSARPTRWPPA